MKNFKLLSLFLIFVIISSPTIFVDGKAFAIDLENSKQNNLAFNLISQNFVKQIPQHHSLFLAEVIGISENEFSDNRDNQNLKLLYLTEIVKVSSHTPFDNNISLVKEQSERKTMMERIWNSEKLRFNGKSFVLNYLFKTEESFTNFNDFVLNYFVGQNDEKLYLITENVETIIHAKTNALILVNEIKADAVFIETYNSLNPSLTEFSNLIEERSVVIANAIFDKNNLTLLFLLVPLAGFVFIRIENEKLDFNSLKRFFCFVFVVILISSAVITPMSISSAYWGIVYAEEMNEDIQLTPEAESTIDSSSPAETETESVETPETTTETESEPVDSVEATVLENFQNLDGSSTIEPVESVNTTPTVSQYYTHRTINRTRSTCRNS